MMARPNNGRSTADGITSGAVWDDASDSLGALESMKIGLGSARSHLSLTQQSDGTESRFNGQQRNSNMNRKLLFHANLASLVAVLLTALPTLAEDNPDRLESQSAREARMHWWREARFGLFVHWGLYSGLAGTWNGKPVGERGGMEWIQQRVGADTDSYARAAIPLFKPTPHFAREWAQLAKQAGCRYLVFTSKHHDGFALHDSKVSEYDAGSVLHRDLVKEIVEACRAEGLKVGFYHSVIDWHHDQYAYAKSKQLPHPLKGKPYPNKQRDH